MLFRLATKTDAVSCLYVFKKLADSINVQEVGVKAAARFFEAKVNIKPVLVEARLLGAKVRGSNFFELFDNYLKLFHEKVKFSTFMQS